MSIFGFKTAQGSIYAYNQDGLTVRFKKSKGRDQDTVREPSMCLFAPPKALPSLEEHYLGNGHRLNTVRIGHANSKGIFTPFTDNTHVPEGNTPIMAIIERATGKVIVAGKCSLTPQIGCLPIEKRYYPDETSSTHIGNAVAEIFYTQHDLEKNAPPKLLAAIGPQREPLGAKVSGSEHAL